MKHLIKTLIGLSVTVLAVMLISCPQTTGSASASGGSASPFVPAPSKTPVEKALAELTVSPQQVYSGMNKVDLPVTTSVAGVTIEWTASPEDYIKTEDPDRGKILKRETEAVEVTVTATAKKDGEIKTKTFKITVQPASAAPNAQALAESLSCPSFIPFASKDFPLTKTIGAYSTAVVTWESADDKIVEINTSATELKGVVVGYDIIDRTVKLTAKVTYNGEEGTKDFNVTVEHLNKIKNVFSGSSEEYEFTGSELTFTRTDSTNKITSGYKYAYTDVQNAAGTKTVVFQQTARYDETSKKWVTSQEYLNEQRSLVTKGLTELQRLKNLNPLKLEDCKTLYSIQTGKAPQNLQALFGFLKYFFELSETYDEFNALSESEKSQKLKQGIPRMEAQANQYLSSLTMEKQFPSLRYTYRFEVSGTDIRFWTEFSYDNSKQWYQQRGGYMFQNSVPNPAPAGTITSIRLNGNNSYYASIQVDKADGSGNFISYYNTESTLFTPGSPITATLRVPTDPSAAPIQIEIKDINVANDGTMSANIKIGSEAFKPYTLEFRGNSLS